MAIGASLGISAKLCCDDVTLSLNQLSFVELRYKCEVGSHHVRILSRSVSVADMHRWNNVYARCSTRTNIVLMVPAAQRLAVGDS